MYTGRLRLPNAKVLFACISDLQFLLHAYSSVPLAVQRNYVTNSSGPAYQVLNIPYTVDSSTMLSLIATIPQGQTVNDVTFAVTSDEGVLVDSSLQCVDSLHTPRTVSIVTQSGSAAYNNFFRHSNLVDVDTKNEMHYIVCNTTLGGSTFIKCCKFSNRCLNML
jgi:hypothetical protein